MNPTPDCDSLYLAFLSRETPHFLLQDGLFTIPFIGWVLKETGQIPVYRGTKRARDAKEQAYAILWAGGTTAIFPEGKDVTRGAAPFGQDWCREDGNRNRGANHSTRFIRSIPLIDDFELQLAGKLTVGGMAMPRQMFKSSEDLMDRIYSLVAEAEGEGQCVSHTWLNPMLR